MQDVENSNGIAVEQSDVPEPVIKLDNSSDPFATVVTIQFGDRLGDLHDTVSCVLLGFSTKSFTPATDQAP